MTLALGAIPSGALQAVEANPSLLQTPQARELLKQRGLTPEQAKKMLEKKNGKSARPSATMVQNRIVLEENATSLPEANVTEANLSRLYMPENPLLYRSPDKLLQQALKHRKKSITQKGLPIFGMNFFADRNAIDPDLTPVPDYYVVTAGDVLLVHVFGSNNKDYTLEVDNFGNINIPVVGPRHVAGMEFGEVKEELVALITKTFPGLKASVNIQKYSAIQVTLTGEAKAPGIYNVPSLSTLQSLLVQAHGVLPTGSLRDITVFRDGKLYKRVDMYDLLTGKNPHMFFLRAGDTIHVPKAGKRVSLFGEVEKPAVYELKRGESAAELLAFAGGLKPDADRDGIVLKRYDRNRHVKSYRLDLGRLKKSALADGDEIFVYAMSAANRQNVYFFGSVTNPGPRAISPRDASLHALLKHEAPETLRSLFLPETFFDYGFIKRIGSDMRERIIGFSPKEVYEGKSDVTLKNEDEIYFLNRFDVLETAYVKVDGHVLKPGYYRYFGGMTLSDAVHAAGLRHRADTKVQITTYATPDHLPKSVLVDMAEKPDYPLHAYDEIRLYDFYRTHVSKTVTIKGEVVSPGDYAIGTGTDLKELVAFAGGFTEKASRRGEIVRYYVENDTRKRKIIPFTLTDEAPSIRLQNHDIVSIFRIQKWNEQMKVTLGGEVRYPGTYVIQEGETLASVIRRAGGFTDTAFVEGAVFTRESVKKMQKRQLERALQRMKKRAMVLASQPADFGKSSMAPQELITSIDTIIQQARELQPFGRITLNLERDLDAFGKSDSNIVLKNGDALYVPTKNDTVTVLGEVLNPTAMVYNASYSPWDYIEKAGGLSDNASEDAIYVVHANGEAEKLDSGLFVTHSPKVKAGDSIVVPIEIKSYSNLQIARDATQILYQIAVSIAALSAIGAF